MFLPQRNKYSYIGWHHGIFNLLRNCQQCVAPGSASGGVFLPICNKTATLGSLISFFFGLNWALSLPCSSSIATQHLLVPQLCATQGSPLPSPCWRGHRAGGLLAVPKPGHGRQWVCLCATCSFNCWSIGRVLCYYGVCASK